jgi:signal transduction histidine kinase
MRTSVEQLSAMVEDLAEMSGAHAGALRLSLTSVPLADLVGRAMLTASPLAQERGVALSSAALTPIVVRVDSRELSRALEDLLATAIRQTPRRGSVRVEAMERDGRAILAVTHTSGGKPEGTTGHAWEPRIGGGRGLTIVRGIVEAHSGEITVHDTVGGSRFELRLPVPAGQGRYAHASAE